MEQYTWEHIFILSPDLDLDQINDIIDTFTQILNKYGCIIISKEYWGEKRLAYPIQKNERKYAKGHYGQIIFKASWTFMNTLYNLNDLNPNVLKQIFVKQDYI